MALGKGQRAFSWDRIMECEWTISECVYGSGVKVVWDMDSGPMRKRQIVIILKIDRKALGSRSHFLE